jgi:hypothetical protein
MSEFDVEEAYYELTTIWPRVKSGQVSERQDREEAKRLYAAVITTTSAAVELLEEAQGYLETTKFPGLLVVWLRKALRTRCQQVAPLAPRATSSPVASAPQPAAPSAAAQSVFSTVWAMWPHPDRGRPERRERAEEAFQEAVGDGRNLQGVLKAISHHARLVEDGASSRYWLSSFLREGWSEYAAAADRYPSRESFRDAQEAWSAYPEDRRGSWTAAFDAYCDHVRAEDSRAFRLAIKLYAAQRRSDSKRRQDPEAEEVKYAVGFARFCQEWRRLVDFGYVADLLHDTLYQAVVEAGLDPQRQYGQWVGGALRMYLQANSGDLKLAVGALVARISGTSQDADAICKKLDLRIAAAVVPSCKVGAMEKGGGVGS